jgi:hypothetical protein
VAKTGTFNAPNMHLKLRNQFTIKYFKVGVSTQSMSRLYVAS